MEFIDTHAHIQFNAYKDDADDVIKRALAQNIKIIVPSSEIKTAQRGIFYAKRYPNAVWAAAGLHPIHLKPMPFHDEDEEDSAHLAQGFNKNEWRSVCEDSRVVALGEIGLDYDKKWAINEKDREVQEKVFRDQTELALELKKPIIIHSRPGLVDGLKRDSNEDILKIISEYALKSLRGVIHCYSGNLEQARRFIDLGFLVSFTGLVTFNGQWDKIIQEIPLDKICIETDAPYLTPVPNRGKRNEPAFVKYVAEKIAVLKGLPFDEVARQTTFNARKLFGLVTS